MSIVKYCDGADGKCENTSLGIYSLYSPNNYSVASALVEKGWFYTVYDIHICEQCIEEYYNKEDEQLSLIDGINPYVILGKDFKAKK